MYIRSVHTLTSDNCVCLLSFSIPVPSFSSLWLPRSSFLPRTLSHCTSPFPFFPSLPRRQFCRSPFRFNLPSPYPFSPPDFFIIFRWPLFSIFFSFFPLPTLPTFALWLCLFFSPRCSTISTPPCPPPRPFTLARCFSLSLFRFAFIRLRYSILLSLCLYPQHCPFCRRDPPLSSLFLPSLAAAAAFPFPPVISYHRDSV